jgi:hypothetical protein
LISPSQVLNRFDHFPAPICEFSLVFQRNLVPILSEEGVDHGFDTRAFHQRAL